MSLLDWIMKNGGPVAAIAATMAIIGGLVSFVRYTAQAILWLYRRSAPTSVTLRTAEDMLQFDANTHHNGIIPQEVKMPITLVMGLIGSKSLFLKGISISVRDGEELPWSVNAELTNKEILNATMPLHDMPVHVLVQYVVGIKQEDAEVRRLDTFRKQLEKLPNDIRLVFRITFMVGSESGEAVIDTISVPIGALLRQDTLMRIEERRGDLGIEHSLIIQALDRLEPVAKQ